MTKLPEKIKAPAGLAYPTDSVEYKFDQLIDYLAALEQPNEVVRPITSGIDDDTVHLGLYELWATYPTREAAEAARRILLGNG